MTAFHKYSNNTKNLYIIISIALLLIIITTIAPMGLRTTKVIIGKLIVLLLIGYALCKNCFETNNLIKNMPDLFSDPNLYGIRNNAILSCILCVSMFILFVYILKG
jgi:hypothetical protein